MVIKMDTSKIIILNFIKKKKTMSLDFYKTIKNYIKNVICFVNKVLI